MAYSKVPASSLQDNRPAYTGNLIGSLFELIERTVPSTPIEDDDEIMLERQIRLEKQRQRDAEMLSRRGPMTIAEVLDRSSIRA